MKKATPPKTSSLVCGRRMFSAFPSAAVRMFILGPPSVVSCR